MGSPAPVKITLSCRVCGAEVRVYANYARQGKGKYCSRACKAKGGALERFRAQHGGKSPEELTAHLQERRLTLAAYAAETGIPPRTLYGHAERFGIEPYRSDPKPKAEFTCAHCGRGFLRCDRPSRFGRNRFCGLACKNASRQRTFDEQTFRTAGLLLAAADPSVGDYSSIALGRRQRSFVNRDKVNHFFFGSGITSEAHAYVFGLLLTDGNLHRGRKGSYYVVLELIDQDIVEKVASALHFQGRLYRNEGRRSWKLAVASPYLFHDLKGLGCGPRKTQTARYPDISPAVERHLIRGIVDGDGSWVRRGRIHLSLQLCGNDLLLQGVEWALNRHLSVRSQAVQYPGDWAETTGMPSFAHMRYNKAGSVRIRDWLYTGATIFGDRKRSEAFSLDVPYSDHTTTSKLAAHLGVSEEFIKRNLRNHALPCSRIGPYACFGPDHVQTWERFLRDRVRDPRCRLPNRDALAVKWCPGELI